jgi:tetratricopeptide (TPR) repeat protein
MKHEDLEAIFVQREELAARLVELVRDSALTPSKHQTLLIGPRGIGKTHLIALVYHRVREMEDLCDRLIIAWLREEEWGVTSFLDLLMRIFRALLEEEEYYDAALAERVESMYELPSDAAERAASQLLREFAADRTLLILVENLEDLFNGLDDEGQKRLRAYLQGNPFCAILATAQSLFNGVSLQTSPFYGFFRIYHLEELDFDNAMHLLAKIAKLEGDRELASFIDTPRGRARVRAVHHLAGGNHRVYVIFSQFLTRESLDELVESVMHTLDDLTPYYQARMRWLSPQQRKIVEFLCDRRYALSVKEIAGRCFITHQTASGQLRSLRDMGYVRSTPVGRESYHELREPLMRLCAEVKKQRGDPIRLLVDFLRLWYSREELERRLASLAPHAALERDYFLHALRVAQEEAEDPRVAVCLRDWTAYMKDNEFARALEVAEELVEIRGEMPDWLAKGYCLIRLERWDEAVVSLDKVIEFRPNGEALAWDLRGIALGNLRCYAEALESFDKAIELNPDDALAWTGRGAVLNALKRWDEALESWDRAIELDPKYTLAWLNRGLLLQLLRRRDKSSESLNRAIELDDCSILDWDVRALVLNILERWDEAVASYDKAIELGYESPDIFFDRGAALLALNRWNKGIAALDDALQRFVHADEPDTGDTGLIVRNIFASTHDAAMWREHIRTLIEVYDKHQVLAALGQGVVQGITALTSPMVSDAAARTWLDVWQELAGDRDEFQIPLRLLDAAVRYRETRDQRVLLKLPVEERKLLEPLLEGLDN